MQLFRIKPNKNRLKIFNHFREKSSQRLPYSKRQSQENNLAVCPFKYCFSERPNYSEKILLKK